jgi:hypothetical protein
MDDTMNRPWRGFGGYDSYSDGVEAETWSALLDLVEEGEEVFVHVSLP